MEPETPEEFEERMDLIAELVEIGQDLETQMLYTVNSLGSAIRTHSKVMKRLTDLVGG